MSYKNLDVWRLARRLTTEIHVMSLQQPPKFELYEVGSQIRRSIKSVRSNIVEGYGRRRYKREFLRFLTYALSSCDETRDHFEVLHETGSLDDHGLYADLVKQVEELGKKLNRLITSVERGHRSVRGSASGDAVDHYDANAGLDEYPPSSIQDPSSGIEILDP